MCKQAISKIRKRYPNLSAENSSGDDFENAANILLSEMRIDGKLEYPLHVVDLLQKIGFDLFRADFKNPKQSGLLVVDSSLPEKKPIFKRDRAVFVNRNDSVAHQRFTIAHEIAHYIFDFDEAKDPTYQKAYITTETDDFAESRASRFAAELLMPRKDFEERFEQMKREQQDSFSLSNTITNLCNYFGVPATAVELRLKEIEEH